MSDLVLAIVFVLAAAVSLGASWVLVTSLERVGARLGLSEALLGMVAALAADAPEITTAVTATLAGERRIGAGVVIGSNVFNLAALIGVAGIVAGRVALHRRVIELSGAVAVWIAAVTVAVVLGWCPPAAGLVLVVAVLGTYAVILGMDRARLGRLPLPAAGAAWLAEAVVEGELELEDAIHPAMGNSRDALAAGGAVVVVIVASVAMEKSAERLGAHHGVPGILVGALVLAAVTSLPNAVAGVYLAAHGRGAATLSTSFNSNAINVLAGLLIPTTVLGVAAPSAPTTFIALSYLVMTVLVLLTSYAQQGLRRSAGILILGVYAAFVGVLIALA